MRRGSKTIMYHAANHHTQIIDQPIEIVYKKLIDKRKKKHNSIHTINISNLSYI